MSDFVDAAQDALHKLKWNSMRTRNVAFFAHPATVSEAYDNASSAITTELPDRVAGRPVYQTQSIPEGDLLAMPRPNHQPNPDEIIVEKVYDDKITLDRETARLLANGAERAFDAKFPVEDNREEIMDAVEEVEEQL